MSDPGAQQFVEQWKGLKGHIDDDRYAATLARLEYQAGHAIVWRDAICNWFLRTSGIADAKGRVGHYLDRVEAEAMQLNGYEPVDVTPQETASAGKAVQCPASAQKCTAFFQFKGAAGWYELDVQYFDQINGESTFLLQINDQLIDKWTTNDQLPATNIGGDSSTRRRLTGLALRPGDEIRIEGLPSEAERAPLDYVELRPEKH